MCVSMSCESHEVFWFNKQCTVIEEAGICACEGARVHVYTCVWGNPDRPCPC